MIPWLEPKTGLEDNNYMICSHYWDKVNSKVVTYFGGPALRHGQNVIPCLSAAGYGDKYSF